MQVTATGNPTNGRDAANLSVVASTGATVLQTGPSCFGDCAGWRQNGDLHINPT
jgi:hypothetical protein